MLKIVSVRWRRREKKKTSETIDTGRREKSLEASSAERKVGWLCTESHASYGVVLRLERRARYWPPSREDKNL